MSKILLSIFIIPLILLGSLFYFLTSVVENDALVLSSKQNIDPKKVYVAKQTAKRLSEELTDTKKQLNLSIAKHELTSLMSLASHLVPQLHGQVSLSSKKLLIKLSYVLPENRFGRYFNVSTQFNPSTSGLMIDHLMLGQHKVSGFFTHNILSILLDIILGNGQGTQLLKAIKQVSLSQQQVDLVFNSQVNLKQQIGNVGKRVANVRDDIQLFGDPKDIRAYYAHLIHLSNTYTGASPISLAYYLQGVIKQAKVNSAKSNLPEKENQEALLALGIYLGSSSFEQFIGKVRTEQMRSHQVSGNVTLSDRGDLRLHFLYSMMIQILADKGISYSIGELKELLDTNKNKGGSGFSFVDLGADRAGTRFASVATSKSSAWRLQRILAEAYSIDESLFMPNFLDLPEGLSQSNFRLRFGDVDDARYIEVVNEIDKRIGLLKSNIN